MLYEHQVDSLKTLGFSEIEALVYCFLLGNAPATGYRIAKGVGKAATNVYAAIESLSRKGALLIDDDAARQCRAVSPAELGDILEAQFTSRRQNAETALQSIAADAPDQHVYKLETPEQVFARIRRMIDGAQEIILVDAFAEPLAQINADLERAAGRKVRIAIEKYDAEIETPYALTSQSAYRHEGPKRWPGQQINIVVDANAFVLALFNERSDAVLQAVWSTSGYLACLQHSYMAASLLARQCESEGLLNAPSMRRFDDLALMSARPPGLQAFIETYSKPVAGGDHARAS